MGKRVKEMNKMVTQSRMKVIVEVNDARDLGKSSGRP
jgi:indole-3-glycerol phosphate synthase